MSAQPLRAPGAPQAGPAELSSPGPVHPSKNARTCAVCAFFSVDCGVFASLAKMRLSQVFLFSQDRTFSRFVTRLSQLSLCRTSHRENQGDRAAVIPRWRQAVMTLARRMDQNRPVESGGIHRTRHPPHASAGCDDACAASILGAGVLAVPRRPARGPALSAGGRHASAGRCRGRVG